MPRPAPGGGTAWPARFRKDAKISMDEKKTTRQEIFHGNDYTVQRKGQRAVAEKVPYGEQLLGRYFDGYPEVIKGEETLPTYKVKLEKDVKVPMRDGIHLYTDIYRPDVEGEKFPALLAYAYWQKNNNESYAWMADTPQAYFDTPFWDGSLEACNFNYTVPRGFVHVIPDPRGVGDSEGYGTKPWFNGEDVYDMVEWIAAQPWCNGKVGMIGPSAYSIMQIHAGATRPPHLVALRCDECACGTWDYFDGTLDLMAPYMIETGGHGNDSPPGKPNYEYTPDPPLMLSDPNLDQLLAEAREFPDYKYNTKWYSFLRYPRKNPLMFDQLLQSLHPRKGVSSHAFVNEEHADRIQIPIYMGTPWNQRLYEFFTMDMWNTVSTPEDQKKLIVYPPVNTVRPYIEYHDEMVRWHEYWLKGKDNGIMDEPRVKVYVMGIEKWRFEEEWPPKRAKHVEFYLQPGGGLTPGQAPDGNAEPDVLSQQAPYLDPTIYCLRYSTGTLDHDVEMMGELSLTLFAALDNTDTTWYCDLLDVNEEGEQFVVSSGALRAKFRALDEEKSTPSHPVHPWAEPVPVPPGEVCEYNIHMLPAACVFQKGHRIELVIRNQDDLSSKMAMNGVYRMPMMQSVEHKIYFGKSHLLLPLI